MSFALLRELWFSALEQKLITVWTSPNQLKLLKFKLCKIIKIFPDSLREIRIQIREIFVLARGDYGQE